MKREEAARYGLAVRDVQDVIESAIGGMDLTTTIEGRERYPVNVRYARDLRGNIDQLKRVLVPIGAMGGGRAVSPEGMGAAGAQPQPGYANPQGGRVPLTQLADIKVVRGPTNIKSEEGLLAEYVYVDFSGSDVGGYVNEAKKSVASLNIPEGYRLEWSGEYEYLVKTHERLKLVIPLTLLVIFILIFFNTKSVTKTIIVLLAVPFSLVGSFWLLYLLGYNMSIAVWVGIIALAGLDAETGVVMLLYLELAHEEWRAKRHAENDSRPQGARSCTGAVKRIRPEDHDRRGDPRGPYPRHVQPRGRLGHHEADRRAHGRRRDHVNYAGACHLSRHLYAVERQGAQTGALTMKGRFSPGL